MNIHQRRLDLDAPLPASRPVRAQVREVPAGEARPAPAAARELWAAVQLGQGRGGPEGQDDANGVAQAVLIRRAQSLHATRGGGIHRCGAAGTGRQPAPVRRPARIAGRAAQDISAAPAAGAGTHATGRGAAGARGPQLLHHTALRGWRGGSRRFRCGTCTGPKRNCSAWPAWA